MPRSANLIRFAKSRQPHGVVVSDMLCLPHPNASFDFAICIAAIHHLATAARRIEAIRSLLATLRLSECVPEVTDNSSGARIRDSERKPTGRILIYVWALEQKNSRRGWDSGDEQDVMVPWVMKGQGQIPVSESGKAQRSGQVVNVEADGKDKGSHRLPEKFEQTFHRYYHLYRAGELELDIHSAGGRVLDSGYESDNWWAIATPA